MATGSRQDHLINTALQLFTENGFHGVGIDLLLQRAGMSKRTLYTYFKSKDELILAALRGQMQLLRDRLAGEEVLSREAAEARLLAVFDQVGDWFSRPDFFGCVFVKAVGEHSAPSSEIRRLAMAYKALMRSHLLMLCAAAGARDPESLADEMALLMEGAVVSAQVSGTITPAQTAARMARALLQRSERKPVSAGAKRGGSVRPMREAE